MTVLAERLAAALAGSYAIDRLLGQGGMAQVFLARDLRHGRPVAIKVFLPEVAAAFGTGRFVREIRTAANLSHPNILALHDSGEANGLYYYVMPYVEGESLAQRIARDGPLPIDEALVITRQVAAALQHAHNRGIVHRDIKPGNILLSGDNAFVADFGIAQALEETGGEKLTSTGFALGTPAYMSPEQSGGYGQLDGRADLYSLGCVLYEMLVGEPPFSGRSAQAVLARHSVERVPSARAVRDTVPWAVEQAIHKAMAKMPADRFATADEFTAALSPERVSQAVPVTPPATIPISRRWVFAAGTLAGVALLVVIALAPWSSSGAPRRAAPDPHLVTVVPFRPADAGDTALVRLGTDVAALMEQHLTGDGGPRAVADSGAAGLRLTGTVTQIDGRLVLSARLFRASSGQVLSQFEKVRGPRDSLVQLVDLALARLLAGTAGESPEATETLAALPLPVVKRYLSAGRLVVRGERDSAARRYAEVVEADSSFLPAALRMLASAGGSLETLPLRERGIALARAGQDRLSSADRLYLLALAGPSDSSRQTIAEQLVALDSAVLAAPGRAERWYQLGETLFHEGPWTGIPDILQRAHAAFRRAVELEPAFVPAVGHLIDLAARAGDTADVRVLGRRYFALDSVGDLAGYYRWRVAVALGDQRTLRTLRAGLDSLSEATLERIVNVAQLDGEALEDGVRAVQALWSRSGLWSEQRWGYVKRVELALNRGRPGEAAELTRRWTADHPFRAIDRLSEVVNALYWDADTTLASREVQRLATFADALPRGQPGGNDPTYDLCAVSLWRLSRGQLARLPAAIAALRRGSGQAPLLCAAILETRLAAANHSPGLRRALEVLDSLSRGSSTITWLQAAANLTAARYWEELGEVDRALTATRRRLYITDIGQRRVLVAQSTLLREEGRLAARTGDRDGAARAYRRYLALRADAEPALAPEVARVRAALDSLTPNP